MSDGFAKERVAVRAGRSLIIREEEARSASHAVLLSYRDPKIDALETAAYARDIGFKAAEQEGSLDGAIGAAVKPALKFVQEKG